MLIRNCVLVGCFFSGSCVWAEVPITVEDLITDQGNMKLDLSLTYSNRDQESLEAGQSILVQTGDSSYVYIPSVYGTSQNNIDTVIATLGFRYGLTSSTELYTRNNFFTSDYRYRSSNNEVYSGNDSGFLDSWVGVNVRFSEDNDTPALLGYFEGAVLEDNQGDRSSGKSWGVGLTTYRAIDPVVLSLSGSYRFNLERTADGLDFKPGNYFTLNPSVAFAVNDRVTLSTGVQWMSKQADRWDDQRNGIRQTSTSLVLGVGYGVSKGSTLNVSFKTDTTGPEGADLRLNWLKAF
jgi:hypothetical protein